MPTYWEPWPGKTNATRSVAARVVSIDFSVLPGPMSGVSESGLYLNPSRKQGECSRNQAACCRSYKALIRQAARGRDWRGSASRSTLSLTWEKGSAFHLLVVGAAKPAYRERRSGRAPRTALRYYRQPNRRQSGCHQQPERQQRAELGVQFRGLPHGWRDLPRATWPWLRSCQPGARSAGSGRRAGPGAAAPAGRRRRPGRRTPRRSAPPARLWPSAARRSSPASACRAARSSSRSRMLLQCRIAATRQPIGTEAASATVEPAARWTRNPPSTISGPISMKTFSSPRPRYASLSGGAV